MSDKRRRILAAALGEFADQGPDRASTNRIAREAGVSKALLFYHFESKEHLLAAVSEQVVADLLVALEPPRRVPDDPASFWALHEQVVARALAALQARPQVRSFVQELAAAGSLSLEAPGLQSAVHRVGALLDQLVALGQRCGAIRTDLPAPLLGELFRAVAFTVDAWGLRFPEQALSAAEIARLHRQLLAPVEP